MFLTEFTSLYSVNLYVYFYPRLRVCITHKLLNKYSCLKTVIHMAMWYLLKTHAILIVTSEVISSAGSSILSKAPCTILLKLSDFTVWRHTWRKNWVNCAVLTGSSAGLRTVLSSRLSHRELRSSLRESHSSLSLPPDTTMASSEGTQSSKMNKREATIAWYIPFQIPLLTTHFTLSFLLFG